MHGRIRSCGHGRLMPKHPCHFLRRNRCALVDNQAHQMLRILILFRPENKFRAEITNARGGRQNDLASDRAFPSCCLTYHDYTM